MPQRQRGPDDEGWNGLDPSPASYSAHKRQEGSSGSNSCGELEPGWRAIRALLQIHNDELLAVMLRPSFRPVHDLDLVAVAPCYYCYDGGLRTAGTVRLRRGRVTVRTCDTCGRVDLGEQTAIEEHDIEEREA